MAKQDRDLSRTMSLVSLGTQPSEKEEERDAIHVTVRIRPSNRREKEKAQPPFVSAEMETNSVVVQDSPPRHFTFDGVQGEDSSQEETFELVGRSIGESCFEGYNGSICVYGQTGAGKTYTMFGAVNSVHSMQYDERRGLICRVLEYVFQEIDRRKEEDDSMSFICRCSFLEIYREQITDLLDPNNTGLQVREDANRGIYVEKLNEPTVSTLEEAFEVLRKGLAQRRTGTTHMNERSSRSHAMFAISIEMQQTCGPGATTKQVVRLNLVDLAGSERQQGVVDLARSNIEQKINPVSVKEASAINKSLSALTNVIMSLSQDERRWRKSFGSTRGCAFGHRSFVNYRDSKLTFLLRDSLGGNSRTTVVANVSPSAMCSNETLSTLKFAARAKHIRCAALRKETDTNCNSTSLESLVREITILRKRVAELESVQGSFNSGDTSSTGACSRNSCGWSSVSTGTSECVNTDTSDGTPALDDVVNSTASLAQEEELHSRMEVTKRELLQAISQLAQVEARLQLAAVETRNMATHLEDGPESPYSNPPSPQATSPTSSLSMTTSRSAPQSIFQVPAVTSCQVAPCMTCMSSAPFRSSPSAAPRQVNTTLHVVWPATAACPQSQPHGKRTLPLPEASQTLSTSAARGLAQSGMQNACVSPPWTAARSVHPCSRSE